jgi:hypothetical protein
MRPRSALFEHQRLAVPRVVEAKQMMVLLTPGLGKTVITETALVDLGVKRTLVIAPASIVKRDVWGREARAWEHLRGLTVTPIVGTPAQRKKSLAQGGDIDVVSYENVLWITDQVPRLADRYGAIVFDELSKLKAPGTQRFKRLRYRAMDVPVRVGLTGSPVGNRLLDVWGEAYMVAGEKPLGSTFSGFRARYFEPENPFAPLQSAWVLRRPEYQKEIFERIKPWAFSLDAKHLPGVTLPEVRVNPIELTLPPAVRKIEEELAAMCRADLASGIELRALSASAHATKARQLASGAVYTGPEGEGDARRPWEEVHTEKVDAVRDILDEQQGEPVLLFYWYKHELERLKKVFPGAREATEPGALDAWDRRELPLMLAHPASAGHGLNLQAGGFCVVFFSLPWSHELYEQSIGRLARIGQASPWVVVHVLLAGDADWAVLSALRGKGETQDALMKHVGMAIDDPVFS